MEALNLLIYTTNHRSTQYDHDQSQLGVCTAMTNHILALNSNQSRLNICTTITNHSSALNDNQSQLSIYTTTTNHSPALNNNNKLQTGRPITTGHCFNQPIKMQLNITIQQVNQSKLSIIMTNNNAEQLPVRAVTDSCF